MMTTLLRDTGGTKSTIKFYEKHRIWLHWQPKEPPKGYTPRASWTRVQLALGNLCFVYIVTEKQECVSHYSTRVHVYPRCRNVGLLVEQERMSSC